MCLLESDFTITCALCKTKYYIIIFYIAVATYMFCKHHGMHMSKQLALLLLFLCNEIQKAYMLYNYNLF